MEKGGAGIQLEDGGWTRLHNRIWEILAQANLTSREFRCLMFLFRQTYGYQKKDDAISLTQWEDGTGIKKANVKMTLIRLQERKIITCEGGRRGRGGASIYAFNKYYEQWNMGDLSEEKVSPSIPNKRYPRQSQKTKEKVSPSIPEKVSPWIPTKEKRKQQLAGSRLSSAFVQAFEHFMGRLPASAWESERISEWEERVTIEAWRAALEKCAQRRPSSLWNYIKPILEDYEVNGYSKAVATTTATTLDFAWEDALK